MSVFKQFIALRDKLAEHVQHGLDALNLISTGDDSIVLTNDVLPAFDDKTVKVENGTLTLYNPDGTICAVKNYEDVKDLDEYIEGYDIKWSELVDNISDGAATYQLMGDLMSKFSYTNRISYSDVSNYMDKYDVSDKSVLYDSLFSATDEEGYISRTNFVVIVKQWFNNAKAAVTGNSYSVDTTNPYSLQVIMNILSEVVSTVITIVCTALTIAFGVIGVLVSAILSLVSQIIGKLDTFALMSVDPNAITNYIKGPVIAVDGLESYVTLHVSEPFRVTLTESNGLAIITWPKDFDDYSKGLRVNGYLYPCWKGLPLIRKFLQAGVISIIDRDDDSSLNYDQVVFSHADTIAEVRSHAMYPDNLRYGDNESPIDKREIALSLMVDHLIRSMRGYKRVYDSVPDYYFSVVLAPSPATGMDEMGKYLLALGNIIQYIHDNPSASDEQIYDNCESMLSTGLNELTNYIKDVVFPNRNVIGTTYDNTQNAACSVESGTHGGGWDRFPLLRSVLLGTENNGFYIPQEGTVLRLVGKYNPSIVDETIITDTVPTDFGISLPAFDADQVTSFMVAAGIVATLTSLASSMLKKAINKRRYAKQALRADKLDKLREAYLEDPTNATKQKDFQNAAYRYNKLGKWFGWGTYDAANGWVDTSTGTALTLSSLDTDNTASNQAVLKRILSLIK